MPYIDAAAQREYQRKWKAARRHEYLETRGNKCEECDSREDLEFHHRNRDEKLSHNIWSWRRERIEAELVKCDLLCSKCHLKETFRERKWGVYTHGTITCYHATKCRCELCRAANAKAQRSIPSYKYARRLIVEATADADSISATSTKLNPVADLSYGGVMVSTE